MVPGTDADDVSRRRLLATTATGVAASVAGCVRETRSAINRGRREQLSVTITTVPADGDRQSVQIARAVGSALEAVGIAVSTELRSNEEFLRSVLLNHATDCWVGHHPSATDPDFLYEALHSRYAEEAGWQNPYGLTSLAVDDALDAQRRAGDEDRPAAIDDLLTAVAEEVPFVPICRPEEWRVVRTDRFDGLGDDHLATRRGYLGFETDSSEQLRGVVIDPRPSKNLNPLTAEYRHRGTLVDLVYDSLGEALADDESPSDPIEPWLAAEWEWDGTDGDAERDVTIALREELTFHDGEALTAADVAFTYEFLADTTLGAGDARSPAPRYRGLVDLLDGVEAVDDRTVTASTDASPSIAERAFTVPILPEHVWRERSDEAWVPGYRVDPATTEALVVDNVPAVGSGPFAFAERNERDHVTFERYDEHFTLREAVDLPEPTVSAFRIDVDPRSASAIERVETDDADVITSTIDAVSVESVEESDSVQLVDSRPWTFYHLGFDVRGGPFSNRGFRHVVARLLDPASLVEDVFEGYAEPIATPVVDAWTPDDLRWEVGDDHPVYPQYETGGELDVERARSALRDLGYDFDEEGRLLVRD